MSIDNNDDVIDSRDVLKRIEELADQEATEEGLDDDEKAELATLRNLESQCEDYGDWKYGEALIRRSYWRVYVEDFAYDIGAADRNAGWPTNHIDWEAAARELEHDYNEVDFGGVEYLMRA